MPPPESRVEGRRYTAITGAHRAASSDEIKALQMIASLKDGVVNLGDIPDWLWRSWVDLFGVFELVGMLFGPDLLSEQIPDVELLDEDPAEFSVSVLSTFFPQDVHFFRELKQQAGILAYPTAAGVGAEGVTACSWLPVIVSNMAVSMLGTEKYFDARFKSKAWAGSPRHEVLGWHLSQRTEDHLKSKDVKYQDFEWIFHLNDYPQNEWHLYGAARDEDSLRRGEGELLAVYFPQAGQAMCVEELSEAKLLEFRLFAQGQMRLGQGHLPNLFSLSLFRLALIGQTHYAREAARALEGIIEDNFLELFRNQADGLNVGLVAIDNNLKFICGNSLNP